MVAFGGKSNQAPVARNTIASADRVPGTPPSAQPGPKYGQLPQQFRASAAFPLTKPPQNAWSSRMFFVARKEVRRLSGPVRATSRQFPFGRSGFLGRISAAGCGTGAWTDAPFTERQIQTTQAI